MPGVTDNIGNTATEIICERLNLSRNNFKIHSSQLFLLLTKNKSTIKKMQEAASSFYDNLDAKARNKALFHYLDGERIFWYYPPLNRHGLPLVVFPKT